MKLRKLMFVLPNLFTVTSIFCGFYALTLCAGRGDAPRSSTRRPWPSSSPCSSTASTAAWRG